MLLTVILEIIAITTTAALAGVALHQCIKTVRFVQNGIRMQIFFGPLNKK